MVLLQFHLDEWWLGAGASIRMSRTEKTSYFCWKRSLEVTLTGKMTAIRSTQHISHQSLKLLIKFDLPSTYGLKNLVPTRSNSPPHSSKSIRSPSNLLLRLWSASRTSLLGNTYFASDPSISTMYFSF